MGEGYKAFGSHTEGDEEVNIDDTRAYLKQLLHRMSNARSIANDDAVAIASLATAIDNFLVNPKLESRDALSLKKDLIQITENSKWGKIKDNKAKKKESGIDDVYYTSDGQIVYLGNILGSGGEGSVYKIPSMPGKVAKIFKPSINNEYMEKKINAIIQNQIPSRSDNVLISTIPEILLYDKKNDFAGYIMPLIITRFKLYDVIRDSPIRKKYFPELDYRGLIIVAYNLAEAINVMHEHGVVIGDLNYNNIVVNLDGTVCLIDTDSYDFTDKNTQQHYPCTVGVSEMLAPELQGLKNLKTGSFTKETDAFSLAILIFRLLMKNANPFGGFRTDKVSMTYLQEISSIVNGECPYVKSIEGVGIPKWAPSFDMLPKYIQDLFVRVFDYTANDFREKIKNRPSPKEWMSSLLKFYNEPFKQCSRDDFHWYRSELEECPLCDAINFSNTSKKTGTLEIETGISEKPSNIITIEI